MEYIRGNGVELIVCRKSAVSYPLHNHVSIYTLGLILEGAVEAATDKGGRVYREDEAFLMAPYTPHRIRAKPRCTLLSLCVSVDLASGPEPEKTESGIAAFLRQAINRPAEEEKIRQALKGLIRTAQKETAQRETALGGLERRLRACPEQKYSLDDMARAAYISKYHLIRTFKREVGLTPHQFQIQNRVRKAQRLLEGPATIAEAALAAGFCDQSHLTRHFERLVGLTPGDYRLACRASLPVPID